MGDRSVQVDEELDVVVLAATDWGVKVVTRDGVEGFVDNLKIPTWIAREELPSEGDSFRVVVTDDLRQPFRASMLDGDMQLARRARRRV